MFITEDTTDFLEANPNSNERRSLLGRFKLIGVAARKLSPLAKQVYLVQFFIWIGWFILFTYNTM
jgi:hypothetical protein